MTDTTSPVINITFDKPSAQFVLDTFTGIKQECRGCGKKVTRHSLGAIAKIDGEITMWHNTLVCLIGYIQAKENE